MDRGRKYNAFISYAMEDVDVARAVQSGLHRFNRRWNHLRSTRVFLAETNLETSPDIWVSVQNAILASEYLILIASPDAACSQWVDKELKTFLVHASPDRVLIVLCRGTIFWDSGAAEFHHATTTAIPPTFLTLKSEPKYEDVSHLSHQQLDLETPAFRSTIASLSAKLTGIEKEFLLTEDVARYRESRLRLMLNLGIRGMIGFGLPSALRFVLPISTFGLQSAILFAISGLIGGVLVGLGWRGALGFGLGLFLYSYVYFFTALGAMSHDWLDNVFFFGFCSVGSALAGMIGGSISRSVPALKSASAFALVGSVVALWRLLDSRTHQGVLEFLVFTDPWFQSRFVYALDLATTASVVYFDASSFWFPLVAASILAGGFIGLIVARDLMPDVVKREKRKTGRLFAPRILLSGSMVLTGSILLAVILTRSDAWQVRKAREHLRPEFHTNLERPRSLGRLFRARNALHAAGYISDAAILTQLGARRLADYPGTDDPNYRVAPLNEVAREVEGYLSPSEADRFLLTLKKKAKIQRTWARFSWLIAIEEADRIFHKKSQTERLVSEILASRAAPIEEKDVQDVSRAATFLVDNNHLDEARVLLRRTMQIVDSLFHAKSVAGVWYPDSVGRAFWRTGLWKDIPKTWWFLSSVAAISAEAAVKDGRFGEATEIRMRFHIRETAPDVKSAAFNGLLKMRQLPEAERELTRLLSDPSFGGDEECQAWLEIAQAHYAVGHAQEAYRYLGRAWKITAEHPGRIEPDGVLKRNLSHQLIQWGLPRAARIVAEEADLSSRLEPEAVLDTYSEILERYGRHGPVF
jgi:hypothetical protein